MITEKTLMLKRKPKTFEEMIQLLVDNLDGMPQFPHEATRDIAFLSAMSVLTTVLPGFDPCAVFLHTLVRSPGEFEEGIEKVRRGIDATRGH